MNVVVIISEIMNNIDQLSDFVIIIGILNASSVVAIANKSRVIFSNIFALFS